jgi:hypothetical protein
MTEVARGSRRRFMQASLGFAGLACLSRPELARAGTLGVVEAAKTGLDQVGGRIPLQDVVGVADFGLPSRQPRLHLVDIASGRVDSVLVAHGRGSDPDRTGWLQRFSNDLEADCTSEGAYLTTDCYETTKHGRAMQLIGLDATNNNAVERRVVVHTAWYVSPEIVRQHGMLGRSQGCFVVTGADLPMVLQRLGPGRLLIATKL